MAPIIEHHGGHSRNPCKQEVRPGAREDSTSPAWLAASAMNPRDTTKVSIWRLDTGCGATLYRKCHYHNTPGKRHKNTWVEPLAGNCTTSSTRQREQVWHKCKIQKNWCTVTVAPTIEHHGGHSRTPANQRWDQVPGRRYYKEKVTIVDLDGIWKGFIRWICKYKVSFPYHSTVMSKVKVFYLHHSNYSSLFSAGCQLWWAVCSVQTRLWRFCSILTLYKWNVAKFFYQATFHL